MYNTLITVLQFISKAITV